ncbi:hypothetical protein [Thermotalea metallivorans]|uniref:Rod shape-determining protein MreD n=1 Tax=Thermotalea metallivorans TaxID=520762 RepID=A0A140KZC8_9FIRM|nr:hypothetical protein [Thermotalea metallivorans]KXG73653.1 hypothetical protein AN619_30210 [Thermotalea metallivorans]
MDKMMIMRIIFFSPIENFILTTLASTLLGIQLDYKKKICISIFLAIVLNVFRAFTASFIIYRILYDIAFILSFRLLKASNLFDTTIAVIISNYTYIAIELIIFHIEHIAFDVDPYSITSKLTMLITFFLPSISLFALLTFIIKRKKLTIFSTME